MKLALSSWPSLAALCTTGLLAVCFPGWAVDVPNRNPPIEERAVREARAALAASQWSLAAELLQTHVKNYPQDADAHNLLGYSLRKLGQHGPSQTAYERALSLDPAHRGAHEYMGELMLTIGRRDRALFHLGELERLCAGQCEEYQQLRRAIEARPATPARRW
jgi:tetratricopeptide (TPR) repeat protein